jgi:hypothetical protein
MKRKEIKTFVKGFKKLDAEGRLAMVESLFQGWVMDFQRSERRSPKEVLGLLQRQNMAWKEVCEDLPAIDDDWYLVDCNYAEYWTQQVERVALGIYPRTAIDSMLVAMQVDPEEVRRLENTRIELQLMEVK